MTTLGIPSWPHCGHGAPPGGAGCRGRSVEPYTACLAHLSDDDRSAYLAGLQPGAHLDHRGTLFTEELLSELLASLKDPSTDRPCLGDARFDEAKIGGSAWFEGAEIGVGASFRRGRFVGTAAVGPLVCTGTLDLSEAVFESAVTIEAATAVLHCRRTRWASTGALRLRHAAVDLSDAVLEYPVSMSAHSRPFALLSREMAEPGLTDPRVRALSLRGGDAAHPAMYAFEKTSTRRCGPLPARPPMREDFSFSQMSTAGQ
ncbi:hypothetical protein ACFZCY_44660 [Streptomyces sp. NPDC007983]|uniref:hypothetical protein n=1 Tax=Streptomyces sp. NPDC007983 TaxID=3364800 RepID=UPI0036E6ED23